MTNQEEDSSPITYNNILELYQKCRRNGDWAKVYLETRGKEQFFTISINVSAGSTAGTTSGVEGESRKRKKTPAQVRRDQKRRSAFLERRRQAATPAEVVGTVKIREDEVEKSTDVETRAGETSSEVAVEAGQAKETRTVSAATNQANSDRTGASDGEERSKENGANVTNMEEIIMQIDGNVSLSDITAEEVEEKIKQPKMRNLSLRMKSKEIQKEELVKRLKNSDILDTDYYFCTRDGYYIGWSGPLDRHIRVYGITVKDFEKTWPKLEKMKNTWDSLLNLEVHRE